MTITQKKSLYEPEMKLEQGKKKGHRSERVERWKESERHKDTWRQRDTHKYSAREAQTADEQAEKEREKERLVSKKSLALASPAAPGPQSSSGCPVSFISLPSKCILLNAPLFLPLRGPWLSSAPTLTPTVSGSLDPSLHTLSWVHPKRGGCS